MCSFKVISLSKLYPKLRISLLSLIYTLVKLFLSSYSNKIVSFSLDVFEIIFPLLFINVVKEYPLA